MWINHTKVLEVLQQMLSYSLDVAKDVSVSCLPEEPLRTVWLNYQSRAVADKKKKKVSQVWPGFPIKIHSWRCVFEYEVNSTSLHTMRWPWYRFCYFIEKEWAWSWEWMFGLRTLWLHSTDATFSTDWCSSTATAVTTPCLLYFYNHVSFVI